MGLLGKIKISICSIAMINACSGVPVREDYYRNNTAIMITGREANLNFYDAFKNSNELMAEHFQRSFNVRNYYADKMPEQKLYDMIREASEGEKIIISYAGHGSLTDVEMLDGRTIDAMFFPIYPVQTEPVVGFFGDRREELRVDLKFFNNTAAGELSSEDKTRLGAQLRELGFKVTPRTLEYMQFYDPTDNQIFPEEILLNLNNFHGNLAFITNACFAGQVNELIKRDPEINAVAFASSAYNEISKFRKTTSGLFGNRGGFYLARGLAAEFNSYQANQRINLAAIRPDSIGFLRFTRAMSRVPLRNGYNIRDEGFNFQRFSRINEFNF